MDTAAPIRAGEGLMQLEATVARELRDLCRPPADWVVPHSHEGRRVTDVVIVGGGMCGLLAWFALQSGGVRNVRILDHAPAGQEGPWVTYARMETLRSPKHLVGPAFGMGSLTFRAWFTAQYGETGWEALDKIPRPMWMEYLRWYRKVLAIPVENGVKVERIAPTDDGAYLKLTVAGAAEDKIVARKVVMATGREGLGEPNIPAFAANLPKRLVAHSSDPIDFEQLKGKRVVVVGIGASAVDNAAEALEAGAAEVRFLIRRERMPTINKMMGIGSYGFTCGYPELADEWRWRFMQYSFATQTPAPRGSTLRVSRHPNAHFHFAQGVESIAVEGEAVTLSLQTGRTLPADFVILGTGFTVDPMARTELGDHAASILLWRDRYTPPAHERDEQLASFPYLAPDFTFQEREAGLAPWLSKIYCFNYAATASLGKVSGDIPGVSDGAAWLARDLSARLYVEDVEAHYRHLLDYDKPELQGDEWTETPLPDATAPRARPGVAAS